MADVHGILLVDKATGVTSHDVVARARRALGTRRIGHAGTLDPMATGLLVLGVGEGRKLLRYLTLDDKRYEARIALGVETDTLDAEGTPTERAPVPAGLDIARVTEVCRGFVGAIRQRAPRVSALKRGGVPLHERVRRGEAVEAPERDVVVHAVEVREVEPTAIALSVHCGKGFYVRSLARDLGRALGTRAHLTALRRTTSGAFDVREAVDMRRLSTEASDSASALSTSLLPLTQALPDAPCFLLDAVGVAHAGHGRPIPRAHARPASTASAASRDDAALVASGREPILLCDAHGRPIALARAEADCFHVVRGLRS